MVSASASSGDSRCSRAFSRSRGVGGEAAHLLRVARRVLVHGAGERRLEQRKAAVGLCRRPPSGSASASSRVIASGRRLSPRTMRREYDKASARARGPSGRGGSPRRFRRPRRAAKASAARRSRWRWRQRHRLQRRLDRAAQLDLDHGQHPALLGQQVDLALRRPQPKAEDAVALGHQPERRHVLAAPAGEPRAKAGRARSQRATLSGPSAPARGRRARGGRGRVAPATSRGRVGRARAARAPRRAPRRRRPALAASSAGGPITTTISPLGAASAGSAASAARSPRTTVSCSLVSSRATAAGPRPEHGGHVGQAGAEPRGALEQDQRGAHAPQALEEGAPRRPTSAAGSRRTGSGRWAGRRR